MNRNHYLLPKYLGMYGVDDLVWAYGMMRWELGEKNLGNELVE